MKIRIILVTAIAFACLAASVYLYSDSKRIMNEISISNLVGDQRLEREALANEIISIVLISLSTALCICTAFMMVSEILDEKKINKRDKESFKGYDD